MLPTAELALKNPIWCIVEAEPLKQVIHNSPASLPPSSIKFLDEKADIYMSVDLPT
jgi:hypothetical protein